MSSPAIANARKILAAPPTDAKRRCHYIAARFLAQGDAAKAVRQQFANSRIAVIARPAHVDLIALMPSPVPIERAYSLITAMARMVPHPCTGLAPQIGRRGVWEVDPRMSERDWTRIALAVAGEIDLMAVVRGVPGMTAPAIGPVETRDGTQILVEVV